MMLVGVPHLWNEVFSSVSADYTSYIVFFRMGQRLLEKFSHLHPHPERGDGFRGRHLERRDGVGAAFQTENVRADVGVVGNGVVLIRPII